MKVLYFVCINLGMMRVAFSSSTRNRLYPNRCQDTVSLVHLLRFIAGDHSPRNVIFPDISDVFSSANSSLRGLRRPLGWEGLGPPKPKPSYVPANKQWQKHVPPPLSEVIMVRKQEAQLSLTNRAMLVRKVVEVWQDFLSEYVDIHVHMLQTVNYT